MASSRPLMQLGINDLEAIFQKDGGSLTVLARLKHELSHRQVPRALALLERIQRAEALIEDPAHPPLGPKGTRTTLQLKPKVNSSDSPGLQTKQKEIGITSSGTGSKPGTQSDIFDILPDVPVFGTTQQRSSNTVTTLGSRAPEIPVAPLPQLALEDACRILKVGLGDSWEKIELARRKLVEKSSPLARHGVPAAQGQKLLVQAKLANDAAIVIAARRSGRQ